MNRKKQKIITTIIILCLAVVTTIVAILCVANRRKPAPVVIDDTADDTEIITTYEITTNASSEAHTTTAETTTVPQTTTAQVVTTAAKQYTYPVTKAVSETTAPQTTSETTTVNETTTLGEESQEEPATTPSTPSKVLIGTMKVTGYTHEEGFRYGSSTASGVGCREGICAINNSRRKELGLRYGDAIYIEGLGSYQVYDCGCSYNTVDIWFWTNKEAYAVTGYYQVYYYTN